MHDEGRRPGPRVRRLVDRHVRPIYEAIALLMEKARERRLVPLDIEPIHLHNILAGSVSLIFHQSAECRRLIGSDPVENDMIEAHARAVEFVLLGPAACSQEESQT